MEIPASASPREIPTPYSDSKAVDPEEAYIASISSCHMLWFLSLAARQEYIVDDYTDRAEGFMQKNEDGFKAITHIILHPNVIFCKNKAINKQKFDKLHKQAHNMCFIAHSVKTQITVDATLSIQK
ncbi:MAG TPA: OsmC family protein [Balneolaceae bacterium]|nr:OsmC family protein [Balneolaceae bacterium]